MRAQASKGGEQPLVRVDDDRIGLLHPGEQRSRLGREHRRESVGAVDVEPHPGLAGRVCDRRDVVDDPEVGGAGRRDHGEDAVAVRVEHRAYRIAAQLAVLSHLGREHIDVHDRGRRRDRRVRLSAAHDRPAARRGALGVGDPAARVVAGGDERREIADRSTLDEDPAGGGGKTELAGEPAQHLVLGEDGSRALHPRSCVDRGCRDDDVECQGGLRRGGRDEGEVAGVIGGQARWSEDVLEERERALGSHAVRADRVTGEPAEIGEAHRAIERHIGVERPAAGVFEHLVDHGGGLRGDGVHPRGVARTGSGEFGRSRHRETSSMGL
jgi:hypothetical protein